MFKVTDQEALAARDKVESPEMVEAYREAGKAFVKALMEKEPEQAVKPSVPPAPEASWGLP